MQQAKIITTGNLTLKQEAFCHAYLMCGNATEAYRKAYDVRESTDQVTSQNACMLRKQNKVAIRIAELAEQYIKPIKVTPEWIEERLSIEALNAQSDGARAQNLKTLGQIHAMLIQRNREETEHKSDEQAALEIACSDYMQPVSSPEDLRPEDRRGYDWLLERLGA